MLKSRIEYYKITKARQEYKGERFFAYDPMADDVIQVCKNPGEEKKGRNATFGIYLIARITFLSNYLSINYCERITKTEYRRAFDKVIKLLK